MAKFRDVTEISMDSLVIGRGQVRLRDVSKDIDELADSIRKVGLLEPIVVCPTDDEDKYEIILGQRRFLACQELGKDTIMAAVLDEQVDETTAKVLSVTENLIRRDLNTKDLIDVCTELYKKYGSMKAVVEETGLSRNKVSNYVKYERLIPELQEMVDGAEVSVKTALRAQEAASVTGEVDHEEAVELAREMSAMSGAQQSKIVGDRQENPEQSVDEIVEHAKTGGKVTQVAVTLTSNVHKSLSSYAEFEETSLDDAASGLIETALTEKGFLEE